LLMGMFSYLGRFAVIPPEYLSSDKYAGNTLLEHIKADEPLKQEMLKTSDARSDLTNLEVLMEKGAKWEDLAAMLANEGGDKVDAYLRNVYGLTAGAAKAIVGVVGRISSRQRLDGTPHFIR